MDDGSAFEHMAGWSADRRHVAKAREFATRCLSDHGMGGDVDSVRLVVSELVTNAVVHAATAFTVKLVRMDGVLTVTVADGSQVRPHEFAQGAELATEGRGLRLVEALSSSWGVRNEADGKSVWATFPANGAQMQGAVMGSRSLAG